MSSFSKPYVGLRSFESSERELFFGREDQVMRLLNKLHQTYFVAVVGSSGSGKSSLIKAGLIPALKAGFLNKSDHWYVASFRPGDKPMHYFAEAITSAMDLSTSSAELLEGLEAEGSDEIIHHVKPYLEDGNNSLLILVDQFEELFTHFTHISEQSALMYRYEFVKIILELVHSKLPIYVILTMRSDFIGNCNTFHGLAEELSNSQFLVPRLQISELSRTIEGPVKLFGCDIEHGLTQKILNELDDGEDQLPILQHTLSQLWRTRSSEDIITYEDYERTGKLDKSISIHANEIYAKLVAEHPNIEPIIKEMFQFLVDFDNQKKEGVRQPRRVHEIQHVTNASFQEVKFIFDAFSVEHACFLFSPSGSELHSKSLIDISHESLMREWDKFRGWKEIEERDKRFVERLHEFALEHSEGRRSVLQGPELAIYSRWSKYHEYKNHAKREKVLYWARRYSVDFENVGAYIRGSKLRWRLVVFGSAVLAAALLFAGAYEYNDRNEKEKALLRQRVETDSIASESHARARKDSTVMADLRISHLSTLTQNLASESQAKQALYEANARITQLEKSVAIAHQAKADQERLIRLLGANNTQNQKLMELTTTNTRLRNDLDDVKGNLNKSQNMADSLSKVISWYAIHSGVDYRPPNKSSADLSRASLTETSKVDMGKGLNYRICLRIQTPSNETKRISKINCYLNKKIATSYGPSRDVEWCLQTPAKAGILVDVVFDDNSTKSMRYTW